MTPRAARWLIDVGALLVPADARQEWRREWLGELYAHRAGPIDAGPFSQWRVTLRCLGALVHAAWLRWDRWRLDMWTYDLRIAARTLRRQPAFTGVAVATLALGIGANAAVFSAVQAVLLRPLPFPSPERLVDITTSITTGPAGGTESSPPDFVDWQAGSTSFEALAALTADGAAVSGATPAEQVPGAAVTGEFFAVLGVAPLRGRTIGPDDARLGGAPVVVLSDRLWGRRFGRDPGIVGGPLTVDGVVHEVIGVMPPGVSYPLDAELWVPLSFDADALATQRGAMYLTVVGRLRPDRTLEDAEADLETVAARLATMYPRTNDGRSVVLRPLRDAIVGEIGPPLLMLLAAAGIVLLVVSVNVAGLVLARALGRQRDLALRAAIGAAPWRLVQGALAESCVLAAAGALGGAALAWVGVRRVAELDVASQTPLLAETRLDATVLAVIAAMAVGTALAVGLLPAWRTTRAARLTGAQDGSRSTSRGRGRSALVVAEVALALVLAVGAGTLARSLGRMLAVPRGFDVTDEVLSASLTLPDAQYATPSQRALAVTRMLEAVRSLPGVASAAATFGLPLSGFGFNISVSARDNVALPQTPQEAVIVSLRAASTDYFRTMGIAVRSGRVFGDQDVLGAPRVAVINEAAAKLLWPEVDPVGHAVTLGTRLGQSETRTGGTIVGVVADIREGNLDRPPRATVYVPHAQDPTSFVTLTVRGAGRTPEAAAMRRVLETIDPAVPMFRVRTVAQLASSAVAQPRMLMTLMALFAGASLVVAALGLYGLLAQSVSTRVREIGVRRAVGASALDVAGLVGRQLTWMVGAGSVLGTTGAWLASGVLDRFVFGRTGPDLVAYVAAVGALVGVAVVAAIVPCRRALAVDPAEALRAD